MHVEVAINKLKYIIEHAKNSRLDRVLNKRNLHHRNLLSKLDSVKEEDVAGRVVEICNIVEGISNEDYDVAVAALMELSRLGYISATRGLSFAYYKFHGGHFVKGEEAMQVYKEAALSGEPLSAYVLGEIYAKESEVLFDDRCAMALHWYMVAFDMDEISFMSDVALYKLLFKLGMVGAAIAKAKIIAELEPWFLEELYDQFDTYFVQREISSAKRFLKIEGANPDAQSFSKGQELREKSAFSGKIYKAEEEDYFFSRSIDVVCSYSPFRIEGDHVIGYKQMIKGKLYALNIITHGIEHWVLACVDRTDTFHIFDGNAIVEGDTVGLPTDMQDLQDSLSGAYHGVVYHGYQMLA